MTSTNIDAGTDRNGRPLPDVPDAERVETDPSRVHLIVMEPTRERLWAHKAGAGVAWYDRGRWTTETVVVLGGRRYGVGYCDDTSVWNQGEHRPRKAGRDAFLYGLASVIDNHGGTGAEMDRLRTRGLVVEAQRGDHLLLIAGNAALGVPGEATLWRIGVDHSGHGTLALVQR